MKRTVVASLVMLFLASCASGSQPRAAPAPTSRTEAPARETPVRETPASETPVSETSVSTPRPAEAPVAKVGGAPDFTLTTLDGDTFRLSDHLGELPIVLNFWAPW